MDENYWIRDSCGIVIGIGKTITEAVENAESNGVNCSKLEIIEY